MNVPEQRTPPAARRATPPRYSREWAVMFDAFETGIAVVSPRFRILRANRSLCAMLGKKAGEIEGQPCYRMIHGLEEPPPYCVGRAALASGRVAEFIAEEPHLGGRFLRLFANPVAGRTGRITRLVHRFRDVTPERVRFRNLETLYRLSGGLSRLLDQEQVARTALEEAVSISGISSAAMVLFDDIGQPYQSVVRDRRRPEPAPGPLLPASAFPPAVVNTVFDRQQPAVLENPGDLPRALIDNGSHPGGLNVIVLPMVVRGRVSGILLLHQEKDSPYPPRLPILEAIARTVGIAADNARSFSATDGTLRRHIQDLETIREIIGVASGSLDLDAVLKEATRLSALALGVDRCAIWLLSEDRQTLKLGHFHGLSLGRPVLAEPVAITPDHIHYRVVTAMEVVAIHDLWDEMRWPLFKEARRVGLKSTLAVPLVVSGKAIGTFNFGMVTRPKSFSPEEISLAQAIAGHLAIIIENARLHRKAMEEHATLEAVTQGMDEGLVLVNPGSAVVYSNRAAGELLGLPPEWHRGKDIRAYVRGFWGRVEDAPGVAESWQNALSHIADKPSLSMAVVTGGTRRELLLTLFPVGSPPPGNNLGAGILLRDVTREKEVDRMKTDFVSLASHELRTPMTVILGFSELLLHRPMDAKERQQSLEYILQESQRLTSLLDDMLNISNIEAGRLSLQIEPVPVRPLLEQVVSRFSSGAPGRPFAIDIPDNLPPVLADRGKLTEVLHNLVDNATKYSPGTTPIVLSARLQASSPDGSAPAIIIAVKDRGPGIPQAAIPNLFTRFYRVNSPDTQKVRGTGLGLYIVKTLVELMAGRAWAESQSGLGSTFYVSLPAGGGGDGRLEGL
ncbi:MAG: GAF domain-containing protein [Chloroflexi bacterium]|nr:GAF domain-containing protein [Chloroflexota bacterium]